MSHSWNPLHSQALLSHKACFGIQCCSMFVLSDVHQTVSLVQQQGRCIRSSAVTSSEVTQTSNVGQVVLLSSHGRHTVCSGCSACNTTLMATVSSLYRDAVEGGCSHVTMFHILRRCFATSLYTLFHSWVHSAKNKLSIN